MLFPTCIYQERTVSGIQSLEHCGMVNRWVNRMPLPGSRVTRLASHHLLRLASMEFLLHTNKRGSPSVLVARGSNLGAARRWGLLCSPTRDL